MAIDLNFLLFIKKQADTMPLGRVLTLGRQSLDVQPDALSDLVGGEVEYSRYCEPVLQSLGASNVSSVDYSPYECPTLVADLGKPQNLGQEFDTIIDGGTLEHVFDIACSFRNVFRLLAPGGRVVHVLPVNNLNGHGFWQFSSDLLYSIYSERNGFAETEVYYFSSLRMGKWHLMPRPMAGEKIEIASVEPIQLLAVSRKVSDVSEISVSQPFYETTWRSDNAEALNDLPVPRRRVSTLVKTMLGPHAPLRVFIRNLNLLAGLALGTSPYSVKRHRKK